MFVSLSKNVTSVYYSPIFSFVLHMILLPVDLNYFIFVNGIHNS